MGAQFWQSMSWVEFQGWRAEMSRQRATADQAELGKQDMHALEAELLEEVVEELDSSLDSSRLPESSHVHRTLSRVRASLARALEQH